MQIYVCGTSTDVGKTHFCAMFCESFKYEYFKLIQAGELKDSDIVSSFALKSKIHKEGIFLKTPASPHIGKKLENLSYNAFDIKIPNSKNLLIETAGGLFTPIDEKCCMIDYMALNPKPCILVASYYLGTINHIILSIEALRKRQIPILALVMSGEKDNEIDDFVYKYCDINILHLSYFTKQTFSAISKEFKKGAKKLII
ncbi:ATP-dependent dethiobiotin synthetase BioD [uncultured Campylobacter sp.]|uniref:dethiobiotin synthase n=1 Tax=uncultured Campylobacter sp. TaxID=218934 RepID=UPI00260282E3|nr:ATP-dependent dethiobiotin synthetase BioD [uncultured Campylobacter sp.]